MNRFTTYRRVAPKTWSLATASQKDAKYFTIYQLTTQQLNMIKKIHTHKINIVLW